ncbi:MAG: DNA circularization N-terminal domain-containing protein [Candidatus Aminicenantes bacterium]|jgi:hypothetical protein
MPVTLAEIELTGIQNIKTDETRSLVKHRIPGLEGDLIQDLGRKPTTISFEGIFKGEQALDHIETLRQKFKDREPAAFVSDITDSTDVMEVVIENFMVYQVGGKPDYYTYTISLKEYIEIVEEEVTQEIEEEQQQQAEESQENMEENVANNTGTFEVRVELEEGETDYSGISVLVEGTTDDGEDYSITISEHENGVFTAENVPNGEYTAVIQSEED